MSKQQEINAIYDRLCWMMKGAFACNFSEKNLIEVGVCPELGHFISSVVDCWEIEGSVDESLLDARLISVWQDFSKVAEIIYAGGGRINKPMDEKKAQ